MIRHENPRCIFLCETISDKKKMEDIRLKLGFEGMIVVDPIGRNGCIAMLWRDTEKVTLRSYSQNHIDVEVCTEVETPWRLTVIYGEHVRALRKKMWDLLRNLARDSNLHWVLIGDMNNIVSQDEKKGGAAYPEWLIEGFNEALVEMGLRDMEIIGHQFTWKKGRNTENWLEIRLDRALSSNSWLNIFPMANLYNLEGSPSDHSPLLLEPKERTSNTKKKRFHFENAWLIEPLCFHIDKDSWRLENNADIMQRVLQCGENI